MPKQIDGSVDMSRQRRSRSCRSSGKRKRPC